MMGEVRKVLVIAGAMALVIAVVLLTARVLVIAHQPGGRCMLQLQPSIIVGAAPGLATELACLR
jgi:hypothetical protein